MTAWVDGAIVGDGQVPRRVGVAPFETMGAQAGAVSLWHLHLARLQRSCERLVLPFNPPATLRAGAAELLRSNGHDDGVLRCAVVASAAGTHFVMTSRPRSPVRIVQLLPTIVQRPVAGPPADMKAEPRTFYDAVRQQAQDGQADDGVVVDADGAVLEASMGNLWFLLDGTWVTPALDGRVLPGIARTLLLAAAHKAGMQVEQRGCDLGDLHRAEAIAHSNAVYGPRPAALLLQPAAVARVDSDLLPLWRSATAC